DRITLTLGNNPGSAALNGATTATVSAGIATFSNLSVTAAGLGYTLSANSGALAVAGSSAFNITTAAAAVIEDFESSHNWNFVGGRCISATRTTAAAHDGNRGLVDNNGNDRVYRSDAAGQVKAGDTISVWLKFSGPAECRA